MSGWFGCNFGAFEVVELVCFEVESKLSANRRASGGSYIPKRVQRYKKYLEYANFGGGKCEILKENY